MWPLLTADIHWQEDGKAIAMLERQDISQVYSGRTALQCLGSKSLLENMILEYYTIKHLWKKGMNYFSISDCFYLDKQRDLVSPSDNQSSESVEIANSFPWEGHNVISLN